MAILAMFPGQGSQYVGMGRRLLQEFPRVKRIFEEAEDVLSFKLLKLCLDGPESELKLTENQQPSILTLSIAYWEVLREESGLHPSFFAGHSLGEYSALVASNKLAFARAVSLVRARGKAMQESVPVGAGAMAAVINAPEAKLLKLCADISNPKNVVEVVNFNSPTQHILSGHQGAVEQVCKLISEQEKRIITKMLPVSAPFHSSLMVKAKEKMAELLQSETLLENDAKVIANISGELAHPYKKEFLISQTDRPVLWSKTLQTAFNNESRTFVEIGPGKVLSGLVKKCFPQNLGEIKIHACEDSPVLG